MVPSVLSRTDKVKLIKNLSLESYFRARSSHRSTSEDQSRKNVKGFLIYNGGIPFPVANFRHIDTMDIDIIPMFD